MKKNNKLKNAMIIFHQTMKQIVLIASLLGQSAEVSREPKSMI